MEIQAVSVLQNDIIRNTATQSCNVNEDFKHLLNKLTGGEIAEEIRQKYNVTLGIDNVKNYQQLLNTYDFRCTNYVQISPGTLERMETDENLKRKVLSKIDEFCSAEWQAEIKSLSPPVKSAGMIVYPDGDCLYWLEGYPNEVDGARSKGKVVTNNFVEPLIEKYAIQNLEGTEVNYISNIAMTVQDHRKKLLR